MDGVFDVCLGGDGTFLGTRISVGGHLCRTFSPQPAAPSFGKEPHTEVRRRVLPRRCSKDPPELQRITVQLSLGDEVSDPELMM